VQQAAVIVERALEYRVLLLDEVEIAV